jgi:hypothetical protein
LFWLSSQKHIKFIGSEIWSSSVLSYSWFTA